MNKDKRDAAISSAANNIVNKTNSTLGNFQYKPPNNSGTILGIIGSVLSTAGDALSAIGAIIQLNTDVSTDFQSQVENYKSDQDKNQMQQDIDNLQEKVNQLEEMLKNNQTEKRDQK
ncbi:hypothetical protein [Bacillus sp. JJ1562]|uniref:hypothetical protein n=1 Tax=Bacillus sp. JJ1562 TaxID=3122960 RepID=UPI0030031657